MSKQRIIIVASGIVLALGLGAGSAVSATGPASQHTTAPVVTVPRPVATTTTTTAAPTAVAPAPPPAPVASAPVTTAASAPRPVAAPPPAPTTTTTTTPPPPAEPPQPPAVAWQPGDQSGCAIAYNAYQTNPVNGQTQLVTGIYRGDCGEAQSIAAQYPGAVVVYNPDGTSSCVGGSCTSPTMGGEPNQ